MSDFGGDALRQLAADRTHYQRKSSGKCKWCGKAWPCEPAQLRTVLLSALERITQLEAEACLYADVADGGCALRATADSPPPTAVQQRESLYRIRDLEGECDALRDRVTQLERENARLRTRIAAWDDLTAALSGEGET